MQWLLAMPELPKEAPIERKSSVSVCVWYGRDAMALSCCSSFQPNAVVQGTSPNMFNKNMSETFINKFFCLSKQIPIIKGQ